MTAYANILEIYGAMSVTSAQMVEAARNADWDRLTGLGNDCNSMIAALEAVDNVSPPSNASYLKRKVELIRKLLADDAEIRKHTEPWMARLHAYLGRGHFEQRLQCAYDSGADQG